jgi:hypothetical protein
MWKVEFDSSGGYDCMTPAFIVTNDHTGEEVAVDAKNFGWHRNANSYGGQTRDDHESMVISRCEDIAHAIATALSILE